MCNPTNSTEETNSVTLYIKLQGKIWCNFVSGEEKKKKKTESNWMMI